MHVDALDFSEWHFEEVMFLLALSVYLTKTDFMPNNKRNFVNLADGNRRIAPFCVVQTYTFTLSRRSLAINCRPVTSKVGHCAYFKNTKFQLKLGLWSFAIHYKSMKKPSYHVKMGITHLTHSEWRSQIFIPKRKSTSIVSSNWQHKFLYFHYKSVKLDVLCRQNKIWTFGNPF